ncbi:unnamed protein product [Debaryomyces fabryi]|nr:unnamed protein product [Debaryomyces fabryi]
MSDLKRCLDDDNLYFTNIISKNGRNEVQIFPINKNASESIILDSLIVKIELQADEIVTSCCWINNSGIKNSERVKKRGKRRQSSSESDLNEATSDNKNLAVALENGDILILSPHNNEIIDRISYGSKIICLTPSLIHDSVWGVLEENRSIVEISLAQSKEVKNFKFKEDDQIQLAKTIRQTGGSSRSQHILIGSNNLYLVDPSKPKKSLLITFPQMSEPSPITIIEQSRLKENLVAVVRENSNQIYLYNTSDSAIFTTFKISTSQIYGVQLIANNDMTEEFLMAITAEGVEVFKIDFDSNNEDQLPACLIKTSFHDSMDKIIFMDVFVKENDLIGVWYNGNEPKFESINWNFNSVGEIQVSIDYNEKVNGVIDNRIDDIEFPETTEINNLAVSKLYKDLVKLLSISKKTDEKVIKLCSSNNDDDNIKETIKLFSTSESSSDLITKLFEIISKEVASQPSKNSALSIWLKWLLLVHGGSIAKQPEQYDNLKTLQAGLTEGMKLMPRLLGLQGRLQLLKSQTQLRNNLNNMNIESDDEEDKEISNIIVNNDDSENVTIANGESDDFEEADAESFAIDAEAEEAVDEDRDEEEAEEED